jgi:predicted O-linked N-acetylglucosamine transferase (SPINDLY family)
MDYYLADRYFLPPGVFDSQFTEKLAYLPANAPFLRDETAPPVNALPALSNGFVTFGSFSRINKTEPISHCAVGATAASTTRCKDAAWGDAARGRI